MREYYGLEMDISEYTSSINDSTDSWSGIIDNKPYDDLSDLIEDELQYEKPKRGRKRLKPNDLIKVMLYKCAEMIQITLEKNFVGSDPNAKKIEEIDKELEGNTWSTTKIYLGKNNIMGYKWKLKLMSFSERCGKDIETYQRSLIRSTFSN